MANEREISSTWWMGIFVLFLGGAGSAFLLADEGRAAVGPEALRVAAPEPNLPFLEHGRRLFARNCAACHGDAGRGGVPNLNYIKDTVPELNTLAEKKLLLFDKEDAEELGKALERNAPPDTWGLKPASQAQFENVRNVIRKGNPAGKKDPKGPLPPFQMSPWAGVLSDRDIDAILAYLLTLQPWKE